MAAAVHRRQEIPTRDQIHGLLAQWVARVDWRAVRVVVWVGSPRWEPWTVMRTASPAVQVVCFDAGAVKAELEPGVLVTGHETDLISTVAGLYHSRDRIEICGEPGLQDRVAHIRSLVDTAVEYAVAMEATIRSRSQGWIDLGLTLLPLIAGRPAVQSLGPGWAGRPAVVVGAGPSLEDDLETLRGISDRALIVAASSAAGALARGGVVPHAWACAEERHEASSELAGSYQGSWLIPGTHCHEAFWRLDPDRTIPCVMATTGIGAFLARIFGLPTLSTGGSVTTVCFALARQLGADPIILVGQDCGMASLSQTHAAGRSEAHHAGAQEQIAAWQEAGMMSKIPAWGGMGVVWSTPALRIFRQWFEQEARSRRIINTSRRGARIAGTHEIPLEALRLEAQETSPGEALAAASALAPTMRRETMIEALREERLVAERHYARALTAYESSQRCWQDLTAMHGVGGGSLSASYAIPSLEEVAIVHPRQGVQALAAIAERIVDRGPILIQHLDQAIAALGGSDA